MAIQVHRTGPRSNSSTYSDEVARFRNHLSKIEHHLSREDYDCLKEAVDQAERAGRRSVEMTNHSYTVAGVSHLGKEVAKVIERRADSRGPDPV
ncbi:hypothetical protein [Mycolicibacterium mageritense]|uniref:hypothetical protein n=1 Tax=Mycolicibacterium mageritense TaxID=53462 RepID=UPI001E3E6FD9|nr:hypothetical protein [Mycolicibacterium mageritense]GJJ21975.1 hypothetical protein MTY414_56480 [Mycolicibacterium mageritense]